MPSVRSSCYALAALAGQLVSAKDWDSPAYNYLYQYPLPIPEVKSPLKYERLATLFERRN